MGFPMAGWLGLFLGQPEKKVTFNKEFVQSSSSMGYDETIMKLSPGTQFYLRFALVVSILVGSSLVLSTLVTGDPRCAIVNCVVVK